LIKNKQDEKWNPQINKKSAKIAESRKNLHSENAASQEQKKVYERLHGMHQEKMQKQVQKLML
jgi:hypothetical protein